MDMITYDDSATETLLVHFISHAAFAKTCANVQGLRAPTEIFGSGYLFHILVFLDNLLAHIGELGRDLASINVDFRACSFNCSLNRFGSGGCRIGGRHGYGGGGGQANKAKYARG